MDAILNYTFLPHIWNVYPSFFHSPMGPLHGSRVKIRGHMIAHRTPSAPGLYCNLNIVVVVVTTTTAENRPGPRELLDK